MRKLTILGAGSWGLTLAWISAHSAQVGQHQTCLWDRKPDKIAVMRENRTLTFPVEVTLPESLELTDSLEQAVEGADAVMLVVTSSGTRETCQKLSALGLPKETIVVNASKGIEYPSLKRMGEVVAEELPGNPYAMLSGPTLAAEILAGLPTAAVIASRDVEIAKYIQQALTHDELFRLYSHTDVTGVELGGSLKNIFAIVSGYMREKRLGDNAQATLITRGLAEMTRFSVAMGAEEQTLFGLSGLGDLLATCYSPLSRNYQVGARLAKGQTLEQILKELRVVAEGVKTTHAVTQIAEQIGLDCPIVKQVEYCLDAKGPFSEKTIIKSLMSRRLKSEQLDTPIQNT